MGKITLNRDVVKRVIASVDWGFTNPGSIQTFAIDGDGRSYMVHEIYQTQRTIDWWIEQAKQVKQEFDVELFVCDPAEPQYIEQFNKAHLNAIAAINDIAPGISALHERLKVQPDGRARFYVYEYALQKRDENRVSAHQPFSFTQEIDAYAWPKSKDGSPVKEVPVKVNDHAMDAARYFAMHLADPTPTSLDHLRDLKRREELARQHTLAPVQGQIPPQGMPQQRQQKAWWQ